LPLSGQEDERLFPFRVSASILSAHAYPVAMRRSLLILGLVVGFVLTGPAVPSSAIWAGRYAIGDSVMLGGKPALQARGFVVNAKVSRQFADAVTIVRNLDAVGHLRRTIVIHLGTNGVLIRAPQCDRISKIAGRKRKVYLVTVTGPRRYPGLRKMQNTRLRACAERRGNTHLIDWYAHSRGHGAWFYDGMHLTPAGRTAYAAFLDSKTS
jgi:hypothetical protein